MDLHQEFLKGGNNKSGGINKNKITIAGPKQAFGLILEICIKILTDWNIFQFVVSCGNGRNMIQNCVCG